ncbi:MAG: FAD-binding protein [Actinomycetota bacterium]|nr:FAD-binding protein [Actinomycetota bacterium]
MASVIDHALEEFAAEVGSAGPIAIQGGKTRWDTNGVPIPEARLLSAPTGIVTYKPEEMIVTARAGTTVEDLHTHLKENGQRTSLPDRGGTIGGAIAVGENDLNVLGKGRVRDAVLQIRYISADGEIISSGAPVVKNVSGFNLHKLLVGSFGTLGLIAEVTLRTNPIPAETMWLTAAITDPIKIFDSLYKPAAILWDGKTIWVQLEGHKPDVEKQQETLSQIGNFEQVERGPELPQHRWSLPPADLYTISNHKTGRFVASIGVGTVWAEHPQPLRTPDRGKQITEERLKQQFDPTNRLNSGRKIGNWS